MQQAQVDSLQSASVGAALERQWIPGGQGHREATAAKGGYRLRGCFKRFTGSPHPDRDRQFRYIQKCSARFRRAGLPILSIDSKKKELIGRFANSGRCWRRRSTEVNAHDFRQDASARAAPYGIYDLTLRQGHVHVGLSSDTPRFSVSAIAHWWRTRGRKAYPGCRHLLLLADAGGSNSCRSRVWKYELQRQLADPWSLTVSVSHYPTGASKWNPVEHRLFGPISSNWAGQPLETLGTMLGLIRGTQGVSVTASLDRRKYPIGERVTDEQMQQIGLRRARVCPQWNYTINPKHPGRIANP